MLSPLYIVYFFSLLLYVVSLLSSADNKYWSETFSYLLLPLWLLVVPPRFSLMFTCVHLHFPLFWSSQSRATLMKSISSQLLWAPHLPGVRWALLSSSSLCLSAGWKLPSAISGIWRGLNTRQKGTILYLTHQGKHHPTQILRFSTIPVLNNCDWFKHIAKFLSTISHATF